MYKTLVKFVTLGPQVHVEQYITGSEITTFFLAYLLQLIIILIIYLYNNQTDKP